MKFTDTLISLLSLALHVSAYAIDASCNAHKDFIGGALLQAVQMADAASQALNQNPMDADVQRLANMIFTKPGTSVSAERITQLTESFIGATTLQTLREDRPVNNERDVMIYCNLDRVQKREDGSWYDSATDHVLREGERDDVNGCLVKKDILAFVWNPDRNAEGRSFPSQLTICPWYMEKVLKQQYKTWQDFKMMSLVKTVKVNLGGRRVTTEMDALAMFDVVLLHEMMHTHAGGLLVDVNLKPMKLSGGIDGRAYLWSGIKALAGANPGLRTYRTSDNAESLAYFANAIRLLRMDPPQYVKDNGLLTKTRQTKRDVWSLDDGDTDNSIDDFVDPLVLQYNATSAQPDGFVTRVQYSTAATSQQDSE